jgi:hypothetical protein
LTHRGALRRCDIVAGYDRAEHSYRASAKAGEATREIRLLHKGSHRRTIAILIDAA